MPAYPMEGVKRTVQIKSACEQVIAWSGATIITDRDPELVTIAQEEALKAIHQTALDSNILETAAVNAQKQMEDFLQIAGIRNAVVRYRESELELPQEVPDSDTERNENE